MKFRLDSLRQKEEMIGATDFRSTHR
jgi:hypothetical protein